MTTPDCPYGFRVVGPVTGARRLVDAAAALTAHCAADPRAEPDREAYLSAFRYGADFREYLAAHGTTRGYAGPCWSPWLWLDVDRAGDPGAALAAARRLAGFVLERYPRLDEDALLAFFSGGKGYHLGVPLAHAPAPSATFHRVAGRLAEGLAAGAGVRIDASIYDRVKLFRAPNSRHPKTALHKRRLTHGELMGLTHQAIAGLAATPAATDVPALGEPVAELTADWLEAAAAVGHVRGAESKRTHAGRLQQATREFLRTGADVSERANRLFRAAADMKELELARGPDALILAVLTEPAEDAGLPPAEVERHIRSAIGHVAGRPLADGGGR